MGGWDSTATQDTIIHPSTVYAALETMNQFINDFNEFIKLKNIQPVKIGYPTGSSSYYKVDDEDKVYGDIDLQIIVPEPNDTLNLTNAKRATYWSNLFAEFISNNTLTYLHPDSTPMHPLVNIGPNKWAQIDMMLHPEKLAAWGRGRVTPERGTKGLLHGNMYSVLGQLLMMSIQHQGVQFKIKNNVRVPYRTIKDVEVKTISTDIEAFVLDIFKHEYNDIISKDLSTAKIDPLLEQYHGTDVNNVKIKDLVYATKGLAKSFEINSMYGSGALSGYSSADDFIGSFLEVYETKAMKDVNSNKRAKAITPAAKERAAKDRQSILSGLAKVKEMF